MAHTVSTTIVLDLYHYLLELGADKSDLLILLDTTEEFLQNPHNRLPATFCEVSWRFAEEFTSDVCIGLHMGERKSAAALGLITPLIQSCPDVWTALVKASDYMNIISDTQKMRPQKSQDKLIIHFDPNKEWVEEQPYAFRHVMASSLAYVIKTINALTGKTMAPQRALLNHTLHPNILKEYERVLGCPISTSSEHCGLEYELECSTLPIQSRNLELMGLIEQHIIHILDRQRGSDSFASRVKHAIVSDFRKRFPNVGEVAMAMALSIRNLQRKLHEENTSFQELINDIKRELAEEYLRNESLTITEISYMLGYAEPAVFTRAYKKWTGTPPEMARKMVLA